MLTIYRLFFFFNDTATTEIYTLSLHDALPILRGSERLHRRLLANRHLGPYITNIKDKRGLPLRAKVYTLALLWASVGFSSYKFGLSPVSLALVACGLCTTWFVTRLKTLKT